MKTYIEFCLFNTWVIMKLMMLITPKALGHPWKSNPPDLKDWIKYSSHKLVEVSIVLTTSWLFIILFLIRVITGIKNDL